ncbi:MAG: glycoside hydrolase family 28 protein [Ignavibacteriaceae bacterium]|nr:glycoside hydrolase family 28 protein [Ignavibacteriaceae bacterium]
MIRKLFYIVALCSCLFPVRAYTPGDYGEEIKKYTSNLPFESVEITPPSFRDKQYNVRDYGAVPDGHTLNTDAINNTISKCSDAGGGTVIIPAGLWVTGPIMLKSNVNLHLEKGALVSFSKDHQNYPILKLPVKGYSVASPILGYNLENIAVTGEGIFDGSGDTWRPVKKSKTTSSQWQNLVKSGGYVDNNTWYTSKDAFDGLKNVKTLKSNKNITTSDFIPYRESLRPYMTLLINCKNVLLDGITIKNSPMFALQPIQCENVIIRDVKINNEWWAQNGDGIDINNCDNVLVYKCTVNAGDDGICMKAGGGKKKSPVLTNIIIADCIVYHAHGGFVIGSESDGGIKNISVTNCNFISTDVGLRFKSARDRGGLVENIFVDGIYMKDIQNEAILFSFSYEQDLEQNKNKEEKLPVFRNFNFNNIVCIGAKFALAIDALPESPVKSINLTNSYFETEVGVETNFASGLFLDKVKFETKSETLFTLSQSDNINLNNISFSGNIKSFASLKGNKTNLVKVSGTDLSKLKVPVVLSQEVNSNSFEIK